MSIPSALDINGEKYVSVKGDAMPGAFASLHDDEQARFFNDLGAMANQWQTYNYGEPQWCRMVEKLDEHGRAVLKSMAQFLDL